MGRSIQGEGELTMVIDTSASYQIPEMVNQPTEPPVIEMKEIKAILYLGIRGDIALPMEEHEVDILA
jgi:hypothetical protein